MTLDEPILYTDCARVGFRAGDSAVSLPFPFAEQIEVRDKAAEKLCASIAPSLALPKVMAAASCPRLTSDQRSLSDSPNVRSYMPAKEEA